MKYVLLVFLFFGNFLFSQNFIPNSPELDVKSYILYEPNTGKIIAEYNPDELIEPASMTKIMTSYVLAEQIETNLLDLSEEVRISERAWKVGGSSNYLEPRDKVNVDQLIKGMIVASGNDAAVALAEKAGGTEDGFVDIMNAYAKSMNLSNTNYVNSTGMPDSNHYTSAKDLSILTANLIKNYPEHYSLYKEKYFTCETCRWGKRQKSTNILLWQDDSVDGVKTGFTESAGWCLVSSAERGSMRLISVVAGAEDETSRIQATRRLLEYGFKFFVTQKILDANEEYKEATVWGGQEDTLALGVAENVSITIPRTSFKDLKINYTFKNNIQAPISSGQKIGTIDILSNDQIILSKDLVALKDIQAKGFFGRLWSKFVLWIFSLFGMTDSGSN